eukprot:CAMPEP_0113848676 /NCGR_PEP_ID=MMETSP0372-20130328/2629_1 /TAXON_ID=340204 /ORGANISM="Lankesteria abbotti" /LENGTH=806 /DNA_ID=CAMNT_0000818225 /DNA_START=86 /DNA_END=2506 /DNA_ORIENTATION=- /assembly_acc=CAM_ASM_000359
MEMSVSKNGIENGGVAPDLPSAVDGSVTPLRNLRSLVSSELSKIIVEEEGVEILTEYVWHMLVDADVTQEHINNELNEFLDEKATPFSAWLVTHIVPKLEGWQQPITAQRDSNGREHHQQQHHQQQQHQQQEQHPPQQQHQPQPQQHQQQQQHPPQQHQQHPPQQQHPPHQQQQHQPQLQTTGEADKSSRANLRNHSRPTDLIDTPSLSDSTRKTQVVANDAMEGSRDRPSFGDEMRGVGATEHKRWTTGQTERRSRILGLAVRDVEHSHHVVKERRRRPSITDEPHDCMMDNGDTRHDRLMGGDDGDRTVVVDDRDEGRMADIGRDSHARTIDGRHRFRRVLSTERRREVRSRSRSNRSLWRGRRRFEVRGQVRSEERFGHEDRRRRRLSPEESTGEWRQSGNAIATDNKSFEWRQKGNAIAADNKSFEWKQKGNAVTTDNKSFEWTEQHNERPQRRSARGRKREVLCGDECRVNGEMLGKHRAILRPNPQFDGQGNSGNLLSTAEDDIAKDGKPTAQYYMPQQIQQEQIHQQHHAHGQHIQQIHQQPMKHQQTLPPPPPQQPFGVSDIMMTSTTPPPIINKQQRLQPANHWPQDEPSATSPIGEFTGDNSTMIPLTQCMRTPVRDETAIFGSAHGRPIFKLKKKCANFPNCRFGDECRYIHPTEMCTSWPRCSFGAECFFIHPEVPCKFGGNCFNWYCNYKHPDHWNPVMQNVDSFCQVDTFYTSPPSGRQAYKNKTLNQVEESAMQTEGFVPRPESANETSMASPQQECSLSPTTSYSSVRPSTANTLMSDEDATMPQVNIID